jgi:hypothetical protein
MFPVSHAKTKFQYFSFPFVELAYFFQQPFLFEDLFYRFSYYFRVSA